MAEFNWIDYFLIALLLGGLAMGYAQGFVRQLVGFAAIYIGLVIATQFFVPLTLMFSSLTRTPPNTLSNMISFFVILIVVTVLINVLGKDAYRATRLRIFPLLDHVLGMILGVASMWVLVAVSVNVLTFAVITEAWAGQAEGYRLILENGVHHSLVAEVTATSLPMIISTIRVWFPGTFPALFDI